MFSFLKIIVNDDDKTVVSENFMNKMKELTKSEVVLACTPQRSGRFLRSLSGGAISGPRSTHGLTTIYSAAGLKARWCGKVMKVKRELCSRPSAAADFEAFTLTVKASSAGPSAFASTYSIRQKHPFIQLETEAKHVAMHNCEIWEIPLEAERTRFNLCLIRPRFIGEIVKLKFRILGEDLKDILDGLLKAKSEKHRILLPMFSLSGEENMCNVWMKNATTDAMETTGAIPPLEAIWNVARISVSVDGIGTKNLKLEPCPRLSSSYRRSCGLDDLSHPHTAFTASIDSAFLFVVTVRGVLPLLSGCYAGYPAPMNSAYTILAPEK
ncbi:hypothetical protein OSTOST_20575 [Ostertagia ostertagi]